MDRRRGLLIGIAIAMTVIALLFLRRDEPASKPVPKSATGQTAAAGGPTPAGQRTADPRQLPAASMAGTVRDEAGAPIAGASVCARGASDALGDDELREPRCAETDEAGAWTLANVWPATWYVQASAPERIPASWQDAAHHDPAIRLRAGEQRTGIDLVLRAGGVAVDGVVLDLTGGTIGGALVTVSGRGPGACRTHSGDDGTFRCWVGPGSGAVAAAAEGYTTGWVEIVAPTARAEVFLTPESALGGVVMQAGAPVAGARVTASAGWDGGSTFTDASGRFRFDRLSPDRYAVTAEIEGAYGEAGESVRVGLAETRDDLVIELYPAAPVVGTVEVAGTPPTPAEGCAVTLTRGDGRRYDQRADGGRLTFRAVLPGTYKVALGCDLHVSRAPYPDVVVAHDRVEASWQVDVGPTLRGIVVDAAGQPVVGVNLYARNVGGDPRAPGAGGGDLSGDDGRFVILGLRPGHVEVDVRSERYPRLDAPFATELTAGADADVTITVPDGGMIAGVVLDDTGAVIPGVDVYAQGPGEGSGGARDDGSFTITGLEAGAYRVYAVGDAGPMRKPGTSDDDVQGERATVVVGKTATVKLVVESSSGVIRGRVVDVAGQPVTDAFVRAEREPEGAGRQRGNALRGARWAWAKKPAVTDTDGAFEIGKLAPGTYSVLAYRKGGSEAHVEGVAIGATVTLAIADTGSIAGTLRGGAAPPEQIDVELIDKKTFVSRAESFFHTGGVWSLHDLPAGTYDLTARTVDGTATREDIVVAAGQAVTGIDLEIVATLTVTGRVVDDDTGQPVPGMRVMVGAIAGAGGGFSFSPGDSGDQISDAAGRFTVTDVPQGRVRVAVRPKDFGASDYLRGQAIATVTAPGPVDLGDVPVLRRRTPRGTKPGDLGFTLVETPPDTPPEAVVLTIATVRKGGPAQASGLVVGDVITSIDGHDCRGEASWQFRARASVPVGTMVKLGLARGDTVEIRASDPP